MALAAQELEAIVQKVMQEMVKEQTKVNLEQNEPGIFTTMDEAVQAAKLAQKELSGLRIEKRELLIAAMRKAAIEHAVELAEMAVQQVWVG
jgi:propionaldehyde dehydrogenase